jgi:hypothetical protein
MGSGVGPHARLRALSIQGSSRWQSTKGRKVGSEAKRDFASRVGYAVAAPETTNSAMGLIPAGTALDMSATTPFSVPTGNLGTAIAGLDAISTTPDVFNASASAVAATPQTGSMAAALAPYSSPTNLASATGLDAANALGPDVAAPAGSGSNWCGEAGLGLFDIGRRALRSNPGASS